MISANPKFNLSTNLRATLQLLACALGLYFLGYGWARLNVFHTVESYPDGKGKGVYFYVTKPDQPPGEGWEYQLFRPAIALEETLTNALIRP